MADFWDNDFVDDLEYWYVDSGVEDLSDDDSIDSFDVRSEAGSAAYYSGDDEGSWTAILVRGVPREADDDVARLADLEDDLEMMEE